jgi:Transposase IS116/IS110/IS902 family
MEMTTIGLDLAKSIFQVDGIDAAGGVVVRKALRRARDLLVKQRTQLVNHLRSELAEFGVDIRRGIGYAMTYVGDLLKGAAGTSLLPPLALPLMRGLAQRLETIPGIGIIGASALAASISDPAQFKSGRQFAAWLGLITKFNDLDSSPPTAHPEPVEGLSFLFRHLKTEVRSFDRLRMSGDGFHSMSFGTMRPVRRSSLDDLSRPIAWDMQDEPLKLERHIAQRTDRSSPAKNG